MSFSANAGNAGGRWERKKRSSRDDFVTKRIELVNALNSLNSYVDSANRRFGVFFRCVFFFGQIEAMELSNVTKHDMC